jgi:hypothetical protein
MTSAIFRCPDSGMNVQPPFSPDPAADPHAYEPLDCPACRRVHLLHKQTGKLLGDNGK